MTAPKKLEEIPAEKVSGHDGFSARLLFSSEDKKTNLRLLEIEPGGIGPVPAHKHADSHFFVVLSGVLDMDVEGRIVPVPAGSSIEIIPGTVHQLRCSGKEPLRVLALKTV